MAEQPKPPVRPATPEVRSLPPFMALQARMMLVASHPQNINVLNPANTQVPDFTLTHLQSFEKQDYSIFNGASTNERRRQAGIQRDQLDIAVREWAERCIGFIRTDVRGKTIFGERANNVSVAEMLEFYNTYFVGEDRTSDLKKFVKDRIGRYTDEKGLLDSDKLLADLADIQWFAHVFGKESAEIVAQLIDAEIALMREPEKFIANGNKEKNNLTPDDKRLLTFLWDNRTAPQPSPTPPSPRPSPPAPQPPQPTAPRPTTPGPQPPSSQKQESIPEGEYSLRDLFSRIIGPVDKNHAYYVENPGDLDLSATPPSQLQLVEPFFVNIKAQSDGRVRFNTNRKVVPFAFDLGELDENGQKNPRMNQRFVNGENATNGDSAFFGLVAASAQTPEKQADLYATLAEAILKIHQSDPGLLGRWLWAQSRAEAGAPYSSEDIFNNYDIDQTGQRLRPKHERLLPYNNAGALAISQLSTLWNPRIAELAQAMGNNKIRPHHLRWIEFLSHSVDVAKLMEMIKSKQPKAPEPPKGKEITGIQAYEAYTNAVSNYESAEAPLAALRKRYEKNPLDIFKDPQYNAIAKAEGDAKKLQDEVYIPVVQVEDEIIPQTFGTTFEGINEAKTPQGMDPIAPHYAYNDVKHATVAHVVAVMRKKGVQEAEQKLEATLTKFNETMKKVDASWKIMSVEQFLTTHTRLLNQSSIKTA